MAHTERITLCYPTGQTHDDTVTLNGVLPGTERFAWKLALETLAETSKRGGAMGAFTGGAVSGLILVTSMTIRTDMQVQTLTFTASAPKRDALDVSITLAYMPKPSALGKLLDIASVALGSLKDFPHDIKLSLAYRIAAHVARCIGRRRADGTRAPTANLFDEMWEIKEEYPFIFKVLQHAGRKGPKENSITILATHAFEDIEDVASLSKTGNVLFIGKQLGDYSKVVAHAKLSPNGAEAIAHIKTAPALPGKSLSTSSPPAIIPAFRFVT